jgi:polar amino acid transport system substrate-binding protein
MQIGKSKDDHTYRAPPAKLAIAILVTGILVFAQTAAASGATLDRVKETMKLTLGYREDARPFSYKDEGGKPAGYSVELCQKIAEEVKAELGLSSLNVDWVSVTPDDRFEAVTQGKIDLLCGASSVTLGRRKDVSFSIPIFPSGIGALLRADAPAPLRMILSEGQPPPHPVWRGSPARTILEKKTYSVVAGTTAEKWLPERIKAFDVDASVVNVANYDAGVQRVLDRSTDVFFGDRPILIDAARRSSAAEDLIVINRIFTYEPLALALPRGDEDLRLLVDRTLSQLFRTAEFSDLYAKWFGKLRPGNLVFFQRSAIPE